MMMIVYSIISEQVFLTQTVAKLAVSEVSLILVKVEETETIVSNYLCLYGHFLPKK